MRLVAGRIAGVCRQNRARTDEPIAEPGLARVSLGPFRCCRSAPEGGHALDFADVLDLDFRPQSVEAQSLEKIGHEHMWCVEPEAFRLPRDLRNDKISDNLALRGQKCPESRCAGSDPPEIAGQKSLQEIARRLAAHAQNATILKIG